MALFFYKEKNKDIRAAAYLRLSIPLERLVTKEHFTDI